MPTKSVVGIRVGSSIWFVGREIPDPPSAATVQVLPTNVASAQARATADGPQAQAFEARLDANLGLVKTSSYYYDGILWAFEYALGGLCFPGKASDYRGKAAGLLLSAVRDSHRLTHNARQLVARGDGATTGFTLPHTPIAGTVAVWKYAVTSKSLVRGSGSSDATGIFTGSAGDPSATAYILKVSDTDDGPADYAQGTDWRQGGYLAGLNEASLTWLGGGDAPGTGAPYYITHTAAATSQPTGWSVAGSTLTFTVPPSASEAIVVQYLYHDTAAGLRYRQTGNGLGGPGVAQGDSAYGARYLWYAACAHDWLQGYPGFTAALSGEVAASLVGFSDIARDTTYTDVKTSPEGNYGVGWWVARSYIAAALFGRHAEADRLASEVESLWTGEVAAYFGAPAAGRTSLLGGLSPEGNTSYGAETALHVAATLAGLADSPLFDESTRTAILSTARTWCNDAILAQLHIRYSSAGVSSGGITKPGLSHDHGDNAQYPVPSLSKERWSVLSGVATPWGSAAGYARYLIENHAGTTPDTGLSFLFYQPDPYVDDPEDPLPPPGDWVIDWTAVDQTYHHSAEGQGLFAARSSWGADATLMICHAANRAKADHDSSATGTVQVYRGDDRLLIGGKSVALTTVYTPIPQAAWSNVVLIDDNGDGAMSQRWNNRSGYGARYNRQQIPTPTVETRDGPGGDDYDYWAADYRAIYCLDLTTNAASELQREVLFCLPDRVFVYDRATTTSAAYPKHLRWHLESTSHPVGSGTWTLTVGGQTTSTLNLSDSAATVAAALEALSSVGAVTTAVKYCDGHYRFTFDSNPGDVTGAYSGGAVDVFRYSATIQEIVLAATVSDPLQFDQGDSRLFLRVDSSEPLTRTHALVGINGSTTYRCRRLSYRPSSAVASVRFLTTIQPAATSVGSMDAHEFLTSSGTQFQGARSGALVGMFRIDPAGDPTLPDSVSFTTSGATTLTWRVAGFAPDTTYGLTGAVEQEATASPEGVLAFTTTGSGSQSVTISAEAPYQDPVFSMAAESEAQVGLTADVAAWYTASQSAGRTWWPWTVKPLYLDAWGAYPGVILGHHSSNTNGFRVYKPEFATNGNISFSRVLDGPLSSVPSHQAGISGGGVNGCDLDGDGKVDLVPYTNTVTQQPLVNQGDDTFEKVSGLTLQNDQTAFFSHIEDLDGDGDVDFQSTGWTTMATPGPTGLKRCRHYRAGSVYNRVIENYPWPNIDSAAQAEIFAFMATLNQPEANILIYGDHDVLDLDQDGNPDLIIVVQVSYGDPEDNQTWYFQGDGAGNFTDNTSAWGLPRLGAFVPIRPITIPFHRHGMTDQHYHLLDDLNFHLCINRGGSAAAGLYRFNSGTQAFAKTSNATLNAVLAINDPYLMEVVCGDYDNDGDLDLSLSRPRSRWVHHFLNDGAGNFTRYETGASGAYKGFPTWEWGWWWADADDDGKLDFWLGGIGQTPNEKRATVFKNTTVGGGKWLKVRLRHATADIPFGIGGSVEAYAAGQSFAPSALLRRWDAPHDGAPIHFGLGNRATVDIRVLWPDSSVTTQTGVSTNQTIAITG